MADTSPEWKKPADIMRLRRRKTLCVEMKTSGNTAASGGRRSFDACLPGRKAEKRKNPFACLSQSMKTGDERGDQHAAAESGLQSAETVNCFIDVLVRYFAVMWRCM